MEIGAQLYTLREFCQNLEDFSDTLKKVADMGYRNVQVSGVCPYEPQWLKEQLKKNNLKCVVTHIPPDRLINEPKQVSAEHEIFGCNNIGLGYYPVEDDVAKSVAQYEQSYRAVAIEMKKSGKYFMHHNHATEFKKLGKKTFLEMICEYFPAEELGFIVDTYWVQVAGGDPAQWLEKLSGRVPCIHLKDCAIGQKMAVLGEGNINFDRVFEKADAAGTKYMLVEQDDCYGEDPFACLKRSYDFLKARGFA